MTTEKDCSEVDTKSKAYKFLSSNYKCLANPFKKKYWDEVKGKFVKWDGNPYMGFMCPECRFACSGYRHFKIENKIICQNCAIKELLKQGKITESML